MAGISAGSVVIPVNTIIEYDAVLGVTRGRVVGFDSLHKNYLVIPTHSKRMVGVPTGDVRLPVPEEGFATREEAERWLESQQ